MSKPPRKSAKPSVDPALEAEVAALSYEEAIEELEAIIDRMEKGGWVERRHDGVDRRIWRLYLTAESRKVHAKMWKRAEATVDDALGSLSTAERTQFTRMAAQVKERLQLMAGLDATAPARPRKLRAA